MALLVKSLKFVNGIPTDINPTLDSLYAKSILVGGASGTELTKAILDTLSAGVGSDATSLHQHDSRYYQKTQHISVSTGASDAAKPLLTDARGKFDPSFYVQSDITHGNLSGLSADDHPQYYNQTRGDARYYTKAQHVSVSAGVSSSGAPIILNASGKVDGTMIDSSTVLHEQTTGLLGGTTNQHYHLTQTEHDTLTGSGGVVDATSLHTHDSRYYTKTQADASLALKADRTATMLLDGTNPMTANMQLGSHKITGMADGSAAADAATFGQMTSADALKVSKSGDTMSGALDMGNNQIHNVANPTAGADAANKNYVDNKVSSTSWRPAVNLYDSVDTTLPSGGASATIDGVAVTNGMRVLFTALSNASQNNRVYTVSGVGAGIVFTLATDGQSGTGAPQTGDSVLVEQGTNYSEAAYNFNGTAWVQFNGAGQVQAGAGLSKTGNTLAVVPGAGITFVPSGDVGLNLYANGALQTVDPATGLPSALANAQAAIKLADATLSESASGLAVGTIQTANIAASAVTTAKIAANAITNALLAANSVATANIQSQAVTTATIADANVTGAKLAPGTAGVALTQNAGTKALDVQTDNASIDVNGSNQLEVKALGITTAKIAVAAVGTAQVNFGTGANQISTNDVPLKNTLNQFAASTSEGAFEELATATYVISETSGEAIGQGDLVVLRRDASNNTRLYKASAAATDNVLAASVVIQNLTYTAQTPAGNALSVQYTNPGVINAALAVSVTGNAITVSLATDGSASLTSTATQIAAAVNAHVTAGALVNASVSGTGSHIETAQAQTFLTGGMDYNDNGRWEVYGMAMDAAASSGLSVRVKKLGKLAWNFVVAPVATDIGKSVYLSINQGKAVIGTAPVNTNEGIIYLGRVVSLTQVDFKCAQLRHVNG